MQRKTAKKDESHIKIIYEISGIAKQESAGEMKYPLSEMMISGNVFQALNNIIEIGREVRPTLNMAYASPILIDKVNIISKQ